MGFCQNSTGFPPGIMNTDPFNDGIRAGEVDMLKDTELFGSCAAVTLIAMNTAAVNGQNLAGKHIPDKFCTYCLQGAAFGCNDIGAVSHLTKTQRSETVGIPDSHQLRGGHQYQRVGTV